LVEMGGVEPPSGSVLWRDSPGADGYLHSLARPQAVMLPGLVASLFMVRAKLTARTVTTKNYTQNRPVVPPAWMGSLKRLPVDYCYCSLIYKDAHFKDGRRIRPLRSTPHPRRNQYIPMGAYIFCGKCGFASLTMRLQRGTSPPLGIPLASGGVSRRGWG